jgi:DNA replication licensing factor MCM3
MEEDTQGEETAPVNGAASRTSGPDQNVLRPERAELFRTRLALALRGKFAEDEAFSKEDLLPEINEGLPVEELFGSAEAELVLLDMQEKNQIFYSEGIVYKI